MPRPDGSLTDAEDAAAFKVQWDQDNPVDPKAKTWAALMRAVRHDHGNNLTEALERLAHAVDPGMHGRPDALDHPNGT